MKRMSTGFFLFGSVLFTAGALAVWIGWLDSSLFVTLVGVLGTIASLIGILGLKNEGIDLKSIKEQELRAINDAAEKIKSLEDIEKKIEQGKISVSEIEIKQRQIEILARKAALKIYYEEKLNRTKEEAMNIINENNKLMNLIDIISKTKSELIAIDKEISVEDPESIEIIQDIVRRDRMNIYKNDPILVFMKMFSSNFKIRFR